MPFPHPFGRRIARINKPMTDKAAAKRMVTQAVYSTLAPQQLMCQLIGGGVPERFPDTRGKW